MSEDVTQEVTPEQPPMVVLRWDGPMYVQIPAAAFEQGNEELYRACRAERISEFCTILDTALAQAQKQIDEGTLFADNPPEVEGEPV